MKPKVETSVSLEPLFTTTTTDAQGLPEPEFLAGMPRTPES